MADKPVLEHKEMCHELLSELMAYIDGETAAEVCAAVERHLLECADCPVLVGTTRKTVLLVHELPRPALSAEARRRLLTFPVIPPTIAI